MKTITEYASVSRFFTWLLRRFRYVKELEDELELTAEKLRLALCGELTIHDLAIENGGFTVALGTRMAGVLADAFYETLTQFEAQNYVEMSLMSSTGNRILVTIQRCNGKSPHDLRIEAEQKLTAVLAKYEGNEEQPNEQD